MPSLTEATLSFLGSWLSSRMCPLGVGCSITAQDYLDSAPHMAIFPGAAIFLTVLSINFIGDGLRDKLDSN